MQMKILVTGGAGFIGSHLVDTLLNSGHSVVALDNLVNGSMDNLKDAMSNSRFEFLKADILELDKIEGMLENVNIIFHLACLGVRHSLHSPLENHQVNADGTIRVLELARKLSVEHFFYISTSEVFGKTNDFPISENSPTVPITVYGSSKLAGEHYTHSYHHCFGLSTTVFRIFNNYGPRAHYEKDSGELIPRTICLVYQNYPSVVFGNGTITRDFIFVKDTTQILNDALSKRNNLRGRTINIGRGLEISVLEIVNKIYSFLSKERNITFMDSRTADVPRLWVDNSVLTSIYPNLNFTPFDDGLKETINYYLKLFIDNPNFSPSIEEINWKS